MFYFRKRFENLQKTLTIGLRVCASCYKSLSSGGPNEEKYPPKFSIANGFALGDLPPCLQDVTITERRLKSLASFRGYTGIARGGRHKFVKSHILVFSSQQYKIREGIDKIMDDENNLLLIFTNPMTLRRKE